MNILPMEKRVLMVNLLVEGMSMRAISRVADVSINTVTKTLEGAGTACALYQDKKIRGIKTNRVQCDEIWGFCYSKEKNVAPSDKGVLGHGDVWTWTALDADTKLMISYMVGKRDAEYANLFIADLASRLSSRVQLTTDGHKPYLKAVEGAFGFQVDYAMLVKIYGEPSGTGAERRYTPAGFVRADKNCVVGSPRFEHISTSFVERQNLTMRMSMRRLTRLTNGFSKKVENLEHAVALHFMHYNFARIQKTLRVTPAMEAGLSDHVWSLEEIVNLIPAPAAKKRGRYKPRILEISN